MRRHAAVLATLALTLTGCGSAAPEPSAAPTTSSVPSTTTTTPVATTTSSPGYPEPPTPPTSNVADCFEANCTLLLTGPTTIPLDAKKFQYPSMRVTAISTASLTCAVTYPEGGSGMTSMGVGLNHGSFGRQGSPTIEIGLTVVGGTPALVLQPGAAS